MSRSITMMYKVKVKDCDNLIQNLFYIFPDHEHRFSYFEESSLSKLCPPDHKYSS